MSLITSLLMVETHTVSEMSNADSISRRLIASDDFAVCTCSESLKSRMLEAYARVYV